jgi:hypothetical protein
MPNPVTNNMQVSNLPIRPCLEILLKIPGGPKTRQQLQIFMQGIADRFPCRWGDAYNYVERGNTTLINKARGLLAFNGLTLTSLSALRGSTSLTPGDGLIILGIALAVVSASILLITHFISHVGKIETYYTNKADYEYCVVLMVKRVKYIWLTAFISLVSIVAPTVGSVHKYFYP